MRRRDDHAHLSDQELTDRYQSSNDEAALNALVDRYRRFARSRSRHYFMAGGDADDLEQEALIGLCEAARDYQPGHGASFRAFAELCITRQVLSAIKAANRQKHELLNRSVPITAPTGDGGTDEGADRLAFADPSADPADAVAARERMADLCGAGAGLSPLEERVLALHVAGYSYAEIGEAVERPAKSVDNALQRIKRKLAEHLRAVDGEAPTPSLVGRTALAA